jgi:hypothetical protein
MYLEAAIKASFPNVTPLVFTVAINVQSTVLNLVITGNQGHVNLV